MKTYLALLLAVLTTFYSACSEAPTAKPLEQWTADDRLSAFTRKDIAELKPVVIGYFDRCPQFGSFIDTKNGTYYVLAIEINNFNDPNALTMDWKINYRVIGTPVIKK